MKILVLGDDLTGCNAAGALFAQGGFTTLSVLSHVIDSQPDNPAEVLIFNTNSRLDDPNVAKTKVKNALLAFSAAPLISKRIDSTFRGNIGAEIDGIYEFLTHRFPDRNFKFLVVAAFPDAGRTTKDSLQSVHGILIGESNVNTDEQQTQKSSNLVEILKRQTKLTVGAVTLEALNGRVEVLSAKLKSIDAEVIVCDAVTNEHILQIAEAAANIETEHSINWVSVDPGPLSAALVEARGLMPNVEKPVILSFVASHTDVTSTQIIHSQKNIDAHWVKVNSNKMDIEEIINSVIAAKKSGHYFLGIDFSSSEYDGLTTEPISRLSQALIEAIQPAAVYASGGETAAAVLLGLDADAFRIDFEILPLAVSGRIVGGPHSDLSFATKGGLIGENDATTKCLKHLMQLSTFRKSTNNNRKGGTL